MDTKDKMLIMGHKIGDTDSFGAAIGIWRIATSFNKRRGSSSMGSILP